MTEINKAEVYRKAAEIIVRDGKHDSGLVKGYEAGDPLDELLKSDAPVCALGACGRAHYELTGEALCDDDIYDDYCFNAEWTFPAGALRGMPTSPDTPVTMRTEIYAINDVGRTSAEDIALLLKRRAEEVEEA